MHVTQHSLHSNANQIFLDLFWRLCDHIVLFLFHWLGRFRLECRACSDESMPIGSLLLWNEIWRHLLCWRRCSHSGFCFPYKVMSQNQLSRDLLTQLLQELAPKHPPIFLLTRATRFLLYRALLSTFYYTLQAGWVTAKRKVEIKISSRYHLNNEVLSRWIRMESTSN